MAVQRESDQGNTRSLDLLLEALASGDLRKRHRAIHRVGDQQIHDARVVPFLINALSDPDPEFRCVAAWALGRIRCAEALDALKAAEHDGSWHVRSMAAIATKEIEKAPVQFVTLEELKQSNPTIEVVEPSPPSATVELETAPTTPEPLVESAPTGAADSELPAMVVPLAQAESLDPVASNPVDEDAAQVTKVVEPAENSDSCATEVPMPPVSQPVAETEEVTPHVEQIADGENPTVDDVPVEVALTESSSIQNPVTVNDSPVESATPSTPLTNDPPSIAQPKFSLPPVPKAKPQPKYLFLQNVQAAGRLPKRAIPRGPKRPDPNSDPNPPLRMVAPPRPTSHSHSDRRRAGWSPSTSRSRQRAESARVKELVTYHTDTRDHAVSEELFADYSEAALQRVLERMSLAYEMNHRAEIEAVEPQAIAVGRELNSRGGLVTMLRVFKKLPDGAGKRRVVRLWHGIGQWMA